MITRTRNVTKMCKLRNMEVTVIEEEIRELGNPNSLDWQIKKCLSKQDICEELNCEYAPSGMGCGRDLVNPFENLQASS